MMNAFERRQQNEDMANMADKLAQVRSAAQVIKAKIGELVAMRADWIAKAAAGTYLDADVTAFNEEADATKLAALNAAVNAYLG